MCRYGCFFFSQEKAPKEGRAYQTHKAYVRWRLLKLLVLAASDEVSMGGGGEIEKVGKDGE